MLRHYYEFTYVEIADVLELTVSAVGSLAKKNLALLDLMVAADPNRDAIAARLEILAELHRRKQQQW